MFDLLVVDASISNIVLFSVSVCWIGWFFDLQSPSRFLNVNFCGSKMSNMENEILVACVVSSWCLSILTGVRWPELLQKDRVLECVTSSQAHLYPLCWSWAVGSARVRACVCARVWREVRQVPLNKCIQSIALIVTPRDPHTDAQKLPLLSTLLTRLIIVIYFNKWSVQFCMAPGGRFIDIKWKTKPCLHVQYRLIANHEGFFTFKRHWQLPVCRIIFRVLTSAHLSIFGIPVCQS